MDDFQVFLFLAGYDLCGRDSSAQRLIGFYATWNVADPGRGYEKKANEWRTNLPSLTAQPSPEDGK